jgi:hypothetical protein
MTTEQRSTEDTEARHHCVVLRPLDFRFLRDDGRVAELRARVCERDAPLRPVLAVTVRLQSPGGDRAARKEILEYVGAWRAGVLLAAPYPESESSKGRVADLGPDLDLETEIEVEVDLVDHQPFDGPLGVIAGLAIVMGEDDIGVPARAAAVPSAVGGGTRHKTLRHRAVGGHQVPALTVTLNHALFGLKSSPATPLGVGDTDPWDTAVSAVYARPIRYQRDPDLYLLCKYHLLHRFNKG